MNGPLNFLLDLKRQMARKDSRGWGVVTTWGGTASKFTDYNVEQLTDEGYRKNSIASACIQMIATSAPEAFLRVHRDTSDGLVEVPDHWLMKLLNNPNPYMSTFELWEWVHTFLNTGGSSYWELVRANQNPNSEIIQIYPLRPDRMSIVPDDKSFIARYEYHVNGQIIEYEPHEILHIKFPDPLDEFNGLSPIKRIARELGIDNEATDFTQSFFENAAVPYGLLSTDQQITDGEANRMRLRWWHWFKGKMRGMPAVLGQGTNYQQLGMSFKDMEFEQVRSFTETRICAAFGVDPVLLPSWVGIKHGGKYSNFQMAKQHLWEETIIPSLRRIESKMTSQLLQSEGLVARFDLSAITALQENTNEKHSRIREDYQGGLITLNEARTELGYELIDDGDNFARNVVATASDGSNSDGNNVSGDNTGDDGSADNSDNAKRLVVKSANKIVITEQKAQLYARRMLTLYEKMEESFKEDFRTFFKESKKDVIELTSKQKAIDPLFLRKLLNEIYALIVKWNIGLMDITSKQITTILNAGGSIAAALMDSEFNGTSPEAISFVEKYVPKFVQQLNKNTREDLQAVLIKAQVEGWTVPKLRDELRHVFNKYSENRVEMIARSEIIRSSNAGARLAYKQAGVKELEWMDTDDKRTCKICASMDGKRIGIDEFFLREGQSMQYDDGSGNIKTFTNTYESVQYPPIHPRCRCTIVPVID